MIWAGSWIMNSRAGPFVLEAEQVSVEVAETTVDHSDIGGSEPLCSAKIRAYEESIVCQLNS
jgi:hypothetical protein